MHVVHKIHAEKTCAHRKRILKTRNCRARETARVKSTGCSSIGSRFNSQFTHGLSQPFVTPDLGDPVPSSDIHSLCMNMLHTHEGKIKVKRKCKILVL